MDISFFLGANSPGGFFSLYSEFMSQYKTVRLIKGGPGCGKSSFMRKIYEGAKERGLSTERIFCSGSPSSLDGIGLPELGIAYLDATSPHVLEPTVPGGRELYLDLGRFYDAAKLAAMEPELAEATAVYKAQFRRSYDFIAAADLVWKNAADELLTPEFTAAVKRRAVNLAAKQLRPKRGVAGTLRRRFLSASSGGGTVILWDTVSAMAQRVCVVDNDLGLSHLFMEPICQAALDAGYDVIACPCPLCPELLEHVIIPESGLAFVSRTVQAEFPGEYWRHIRLEAMPDAERLRSLRRQLQRHSKLRQALLDEACASIGRANQLHDKLEELYNPHVDFDSVYALAAEHVKAVAAACMP